jgi:hypothetical protein
MLSLRRPLGGPGGARRRAGSIARTRREGVRKRPDMSCCEPINMVQACPCRIFKPERTDCEAHPRLARRARVLRSGRRAESARLC